jgi:Bacterial Ig domain
MNSTVTVLCNKGHDGLDRPDRSRSCRGIHRVVSCARRLASNALALVSGALLLLSANLANASHTVFCRADSPVHPGELMTWRASVSGGSGSFTYSWSDDGDGLTGSSQAVTIAYASVGFRLARVTVTDTVNGDVVTSGCHSHVTPVSFSEPPNVNPVLWVPHNVDPAPLIPQVRRVWRQVQAAFFDQYGKTFRMNPLTTIVSPDTEFDICGGDCSETPNGAGVLMNRATQQAQAAVGSVVPYTRSIHVLAWGAGGFAGSFGWDFPLSMVGDWALGSLAAPPIPRMPAGIGGGFDLDAGRYSTAVDTIAHELNHGIGFDDPHDFSLSAPPNDYERQFSLAGPWLTETPADVTDPTATFTAPAAGATLSGIATVSVNAADATGMDAVVFLVDDQFMAVDRSSPFSFAFDTTKVGFGLHALEAIAYDSSGNTTRVTRSVNVRNQVAATSCSATFPQGVLHVCFFDGANFNGPYLGTLLDTPFPVPSSNLGAGILHGDFGEVAFGQSDTVSGIWRGTLSFPRGNYILGFFTDDGLRVRVNDILILDEWRDQVQDFEKIVALNGPTRLQIEWFQNGGSYALNFRWRPTSLEPNAGTITRAPGSTIVTAGALLSGNFSSLAANDNNYLAVSSTTAGTRTTAWYGEFVSVHRELTNLRVRYVGKNSRTCSQTVAIWNWTTNKWVQLDSRQVGTTEATIKNLAPPAPQSNFVGGPIDSSGRGHARVRVRCQSAGNFTARGDLLRIDYLLPP